MPNIVFQPEHIKKSIVKWWQTPLLWILPTYVKINEGHAIYYKIWRGKLFIMGYEKIDVVESDPELGGTK